MKPNSAKMWPDQGRQIYREPDGTTITLTALDGGKWHAQVKWQGRRAEAAPFESNQTALEWARTTRAEMPGSTIIQGTITTTMPPI